MAHRSIYGLSTSHAVDSAQKVRVLVIKNRGETLSSNRRVTKEKKNKRDGEVEQKGETKGKESKESNTDMQTSDMQNSNKTCMNRNHRH